MRPSIPAHFARTTIPALVAALLGGVATTGHAAVGVKVIIQGWEPWNDNRQPTVVAIDSADFISAPLSKGWEEVRGPICDAFTQALQRPDLVHPGVTLYNVSCQFNAADIRLVKVSESRAKLLVLLPASRIAATSTTPNLSQLGADAPLIGDLGLPGATDPRFSVSVDARFEVDVEIGDAPRPFLTVHQVRLNLLRADARGENLTGKLAEWVASKVIPFFGGPNFERMGESLINGVGANFTGPVQRALAPVNARIAGYAQYALVKPWMSPTRIAIALQPRQLPAPVLRGEMRGVFRDARIVGSAAPGHAACQGFRVNASYQTRPAPIVNPDTLELGPAERVPVGAMAALQPLPDGSCAYAVSGLAMGVTNYVKATHPFSGFAGGSSLVSMKTKLLPKGWEGHSVRPSPVSSSRDYVLVSDLYGQAGVVELDPRRTRIDPIVSHVNLQVHANMSKAAGVAAIGSAVGLNPQPLPPRLESMASKTLTPARVAPSAGVAAIGAAVALNPQPLPPKLEMMAPQTMTPARAAPSAGAAAIGSAVALNPQPLPPKLEMMAPQTMTPARAAPSAGAAAIGSAVALNPQPLPPKLEMMAPKAMTPARSAPSAGVAAIGAAVALNPQPLPPKLEMMTPSSAATPVLAKSSAGVSAIGSAAQSAAAARLTFVR